MKLKKLWVAVLCAACLIGSKKSIASEPLVTLHDKPMLTSGEVMQEMDNEIPRIDPQSTTRDEIKKAIFYGVKERAMGLIIEEWFKRHADQEDLVTKEALQDFNNRNLKRAYSEEDYLANTLPAYRREFFWKKHSISPRMDSSNEIPKEIQTIFDKYTTEYGIEIHEENVNKLIDRIVQKIGIKE